MASPRTPRPTGTLALVLIVTVAALAAGCAWLRWRSLALTHVDLMERLALDGAETLGAPNRGLEPSDIERLRYPLERARAFAASSRRRFDDAAWLGDFDTLLGTYGELIDYLDKARSRRVGSREKRRAAELAREVAAAAGEVRRELAGDGAERATSWLCPSRPGSARARCRSAGA